MEWIKRAHPTLNISWRYPWYSWIFAHSTVGRHESTHSYGRWRPRNLCHCSYSRRSPRTGSSFLHVHSSLANTLRDGAKSNKINQISWNKGKNKNVLYPTTWMVEIGLLYSHSWVRLEYVNIRQWFHHKRWVHLVLLGKERLRADLGN